MILDDDDDDDVVVVVVVVCDPIEKKKALRIIWPPYLRSSEFRSPRPNHPMSQLRSILVPYRVPKLMGSNTKYEMTGITGITEITHANRSRQTANHGKCAHPDALVVPVHRIRSSHEATRKESSPSSHPLFVLCFVFCWFLNSLLSPRTTRGSSFHSILFFIAIAIAIAIIIAPALCFHSLQSSFLLLFTFMSLL